MTFSPPRRLEDSDSLAGFECGVSLVDNWVHSYAKKAFTRGTAVVYVVYSKELPAGLYSLSTHSVQRSDIKSGWLKRNAPESIPVVLLGMLAVDKRFQGCGLGKSLLRDVILRSQGIVQHIGARAILVDPVNEDAVSFYTKYGFHPLLDSDRMFLPLK